MKQIQIFFMLTTFISLINFLNAFKCQSNSECECKNLTSSSYEVHCKNGTIKQLFGKDVTEVRYLRMEKPISNADLILYPRTSVLDLSNNYLGNVSKDLLKGK